MRQKILIIRFSSIGDIILTTPVVKSLRAQYPDAQIDFLTLSHFSEVISGNKNLNNILLFDKNTYQGKKGIKKFAEELSAFCHYDIAIDLHSKIRSKLLCQYLKIPVYRYKKRALWKTLGVKLKLIRYAVDDTIVNSYFSAVKPLAVKNIGEQLDFFVTSKDLSLVPKYPYVVMAIGASKETKKWPIENYVNLAEKFQEKVIFVGDKNDEAKLKPLLKGSDHIINMCGHLTLKQSGAIISQAKLVVCNDSAVFHIARAFKRKTAVFFGPTDPNMFTFSSQELLLSSHESCQPCSLHGDKKCPKGHFNCMKRQTVESVYSQLCEFMPSRSDDQH